VLFFLVSFELAFCLAV